MSLTHVEEGHSNNPPDKVLGEEVWSLETSCYSWNGREAVRLDLDVTSVWLLDRSLRSQSPSPPLPATRQSLFLKCIGKLDSWVLLRRLLLHIHTHTHTLGWQSPAIIEVSPRLEIVSTAAERLLLLSHLNTQPAPSSIPSFLPTIARVSALTHTQRAKLAITAQHQ